MTGFTTKQSSVVMTRQNVETKMPVKHSLNRWQNPTYAKSTVVKRAFKKQEWQNDFHVKIEIITISQFDGS